MQHLLTDDTKGQIVALLNTHTRTAGKLRKFLTQTDTQIHPPTHTHPQNTHPIAHSDIPQYVYAKNKKKELTTLAAN